MQFNEEYLEHDDGVIYIQTYGDGPELFLLGGGLGSGVEYLYPLMERLSSDYKLYLINQRGTGKSKVTKVNANSINLDACIRDIEAIRVHFTDRPLNLLSHSWGASLALAYLEKHPDKVDKLIMINSMGLTTAAFAYLLDNIWARFSGPELEKLRYLINQNQISKDFDQSYQAFFEFAQRAYFFDKDLAKKFQKNDTPSFFSLDVYRLMLQDLVKRRFDLRKGFQTSCEMHLIWGRQDIMGAQPLYDLAKAFPDLNARVIERCGHYPWFEQEERFYKILGDILT